jgi:L-fuconolactonase
MDEQRRCSPIPRLFTVHTRIHTQVVIDHMAKPPIVRGELHEWAQEMKKLAAYANIHCKLSGLVTEANLTAWRVDDLRPFVECALEFFGRND